MSVTGASTPQRTMTTYSGELMLRHADTVERARREAAQYRPPSNAVLPDQNEVELQTEAEKWIAAEHQTFTLALTDASRGAYELQEKVPELEARIQQLLADNSHESEVEAALAEEKSSVVAAAEQRIRAEVDLRSFRARHSITEEAVYPESHIWHFAIILSLALIETIINAFFYENAEGLLGGFMVALGVAAINMSGALVLGMLFRYKNLTDGDKRAGGWACLALFAVLTVYCNALFAAFRAEYQLISDPSDPTQIRRAFRVAAEQASRVFVLGMEFGDLMSFVLFGIGLLLSCFAFYKGYTFDDRYPGHGAKDRAVRSARRAEEARQEAARGKVKELLQRRRNELQRVSREPAELMALAARRAAALQNGHAAWRANQDAIQRDFSLLLRAYRDTNTAIRAADAPAYFATIPEVRRPSDAEAIARVLSILSTCISETQSVRDRYQERLNTKLTNLQRDTATLLDGQFAAFLRSVEVDAEAAIERTSSRSQRAMVGTHAAHSL